MEPADGGVCAGCIADGNSVSVLSEIFCGGDRDLGIEIEKRGEGL